MNIIDFGGKGGRSQNDIADSRFTAGIGMTVEEGEKKRACPPSRFSPARNTLSQGTKQFSKSDKNRYSPA